MDNNDDRSRKIEARVFQRLISHLQNQPDLQNIDLMILADFCRNCLAKWYRTAAEEEGMVISDGEAREIVYGMTYDEYKERYQKEASSEQLAAYEKRKN